MCGDVMNVYDDGVWMCVMCDGVCVDVCGCDADDVWMCGSVVDLSGCVMDLWMDLFFDDLCDV